MFVNNKLTVKGKIIKIISNKEFNSYFKYNKKGKRVNALEIIKYPTKTKKTLFKYMLNSLMTFIKSIYMNLDDYDNFLFENIYVIEENHDYKVNDIVEINIVIKKVK